MLVNIALVSCGSPDARTTRTASATASATPPAPSFLVTLAWVSCATPAAPTPRPASATASATPPVSSEPAGLMLNATIMNPDCHDPLHSPYTETRSTRTTGSDAPRDGPHKA